MTLNFPGPFEVEILYTVNAQSLGLLNHRQRLNVIVPGTPPVPGTPMTAINFLTRAGTNVQADQGILAYLAVVLPFYTNTLANFLTADLYQYETGTFNRDFISTYNINQAGVGSVQLTAAQQSIFTFRTIEGGILKLNLLESIRSGNAVAGLAAATGIVGALRDYVMGTTNWIIARDTSQPAAPLRSLEGQNEAVYRKRFRALN